MTHLRGHKVVLASDMARAEAESYQEGASEETFMHAAGEAVALSTAEYITKNHLEKHVTLLIGKGNNGGDAFVAGLLLMEKGYEVEALTVFDLEDCSPLNQVQAAHFQNSGGSIRKIDAEENIHFSQKGVILDGLLGTGFKGSIKGALLTVIRAVNRSKIPVVSIDIPSGVNGNTGHVNPEAITAKKTIALGLFKAGCFLLDGYRHLGDYEVKSFGLAPKYTQPIQAIGYLIDESQVASVLPPIQKDRHKYQAGYVVGISGSKGMGGAAKLASLAALRSGAGIVRLFYSEEMEEEMQNSALELIREPWDLHDLSSIQNELKRAKAVFIGPGLGRKEEISKLLRKILPEIKVASVIDADGLFFLAEHPQTTIDAPVIITPHHKEMARLLGQEKLGEDFLEKCQTFADAKQWLIVLKGAPTFVFEPGKDPIIIAHGDPGMATAGTGDVLTGVIAALLAQGLQPNEAACLGVYLHAVAGEIAAVDLGSYSIIASDLIEYLPDSFQKLLKKDR